MSPDPQTQNTLILDQRNVDVALATGIFLLESKLQHKDKILPLLLNLLKCLPYAKFIEERECKRKEEGCLAEGFSFHFVSLLLGIGALQREENSLKNDILSSVVDVFEVLIQQCCSVTKQSNAIKGKHNQ